MEGFSVHPRYRSHTDIFGFGLKVSVKAHPTRCCRHTFRGTNIEREAAEDWIYDLDLGLEWQTPIYSPQIQIAYLYLWVRGLRPRNGSTTSTWALSGPRTRSILKERERKRKRARDRETELCLTRVDRIFSM
jgi:hypothetical protein